MFFLAWMLVSVCGGTVGEHFCWMPYLRVARGYAASQPVSIGEGYSTLYI